MSSVFALFFWASGNGSAWPRSMMSKGSGRRAASRLFKL